MSELSAVKAWAKEAQDYIEANIPKTGAGDLGVARAVAVGALMSLRLKLQRLHRALPTTAGDVETARLLVETLSHEEGELSEAQQAVRQVCNALISLSAALSGDGRDGGVK